MTEQEKIDLWLAGFNAGCSESKSAVYCGHFDSFADDISDEMDRRKENGPELAKKAIQSMQ